MNNYKKSLFEKYVYELAKKYRIKHDYFSGLGMACGIYTGGETLGPCTKRDINEIYGPAIKDNLEYYIEEAKKGIKFQRWFYLIKASIGEVSMYEWEHIRNNLKIDKKLRVYLDELIKLDPKSNKQPKPL